MYELECPPAWPQANNIIRGAAAKCGVEELANDRGPTFCLRRSPPQEPPEENAPPAQRGPRRESRLSRRLTCSVADLHRSGFLKWGTDVCGCATARLYGLPGRGRGTRHSARGGEQGRRQAAHGVVGRPVDIRWDLQRRAGSAGISTEFSRSTYNPGVLGCVHPAADRIPVRRSPYPDPPDSFCLRTS